MIKYHWPSRLSGRLFYFSPMSSFEVQAEASFTDEALKKTSGMAIIRRSFAAFLGCKGQGHIEDKEDGMPGRNGRCEAESYFDYKEKNSVFTIL